MSAAGHQAPRAPASDEADVKDTFASANSIIITSMLLLIIVLSYRINTNRLRHLPESGAAIALGFFTGLTVRVLDLIEEEQLLSFNGEFFFFVLLPPIIFEAGLSLETRIFVDNLGAILLFAIGGTLVSAWVVAEGTLWFANLGILGLVKEQDLGISCNLFGALISATDPVATIALFGSSRFRADPLVQPPRRQHPRLPWLLRRQLGLHRSPAVATEVTVGFVTWARSESIRAGTSTKRLHASTRRTCSRCWEGLPGRGQASATMQSSCLAFRTSSGSRA
eukprot:gnl/TRDRNA2_/TRDRNA2_128663_c0_seq2.p1 gnl/TRDRNA2_/TRDRNA2_128663_c0~~gnl/TRDRNA2_/TRDRNA2_128663_c0_seq2.p1  ORF type:complete len:321 (+),score=27.20 gnl/TRDRNA2_/TRDRNA2_128663_c0_seq2:126-965(+)